MGRMATTYKSLGSSTPLMNHHCWYGGCAVVQCSHQILPKYGFEKTYGIAYSWEHFMLEYLSINPLPSPSNATGSQWDCTFNDGRSLVWWDYGRTIDSWRFAMPIEKVHVLNSFGFSHKTLELPVNSFLASISKGKQLFDAFCVVLWCSSHLYSMLSTSQSTWIHSGTW